MSKIMERLIRHQVYNQDDFILDMKALIVAEKTTDAETKEVELTINGGKCPFCGKAWQAMEKNSKFAHYNYFVSACNCYDKSKQEIDYMAEEIKFNDAAGIPWKYHKVSLKNIDKTVRTETLAVIDAVIKYAINERYLEKGLVIFGDDSGTGKTMLTISVMKRAAIKHKKSALFVDCSKLDSELMRDNDYLFTILGKDIVLLDDIDKSVMGRTENEHHLKNFFTIINCLLENGKLLLITSNIDTKEKFVEVYSKFYKDKIVGRLFESCEFMRITGDNYRMKTREDLL